MQTRRYRLFMSFLCLVLSVLGLSHPATAAPTHLRAELVAGAPAEPGGETMIAIHMTPEKGWHGYWLNPGDAGLAMQLNWTLPAGVKVGEPRYPVPQTLVVSDLMNHVFERDYAVLVPLTLPVDAVAGTRLPVRLSAQWLVCTNEICVPERADLALEIPVAASVATPAATKPGTLSGQFAEWMRRLPAPLDRDAAFQRDANTVRLAIPLTAETNLEGPHLFIAEDKVVDYGAAQQFSRKGDLLLITIPRAKLDARDAQSLTGVLRLNAAGDGVSFVARSGPVPVGGKPLKGVSPPPVDSLPWLLFAAMAGGLLLNVMPCVFPILSLKALSLARSGESEAHARIEGLAYAAGVIIACLGLGALLLALRAGGEQVGWAFQLQEPLVVAGLLLLAGAITANLLGLFEFAVPGVVAARSPSSFTRGAFFTGLLAAFVATPCTGPFMASAMGAALLLPLPAAMSLFAALGFGIALPFLAIAFIPSLRKGLPRPGAWMAAFRRWLALPMGLTALALAWLTFKVGGTWFMAGALLGLALVLAALAAMGQAQRKGLAARPTAAIAIVVAAFTLIALPQPRPVEERSGSMLDARSFSATSLEKARARGTPVFVWMTADWCLTCKVNEQAAIERKETRAAFKKADVTVLRGDWTRRDPEITRYLTDQGAAGVPLYVWYGADGTVEQLPQVLTPAMLAQKAAQ